MADFDKLLVRYKIFIRLLSGKTIPLQVKSSDKIGFVKAIIQIKEGIPIDELHLIFNGKYLANDRYLYNYDIEMNSILFVTLDHTCRDRRIPGKTIEIKKKSGDDNYSNSLFVF